MHQDFAVARKIILIVTALVVPGGLLALLGAWLLKSFAQTERGRKVFQIARNTVPSWVGGWRSAPEQRQAA